MRTIEYYDSETDTWSGTEWSTVVSGMTVRMYEEDGTPIHDGSGAYEMNVVGDAYLQTISGSEDVWTIDIMDSDPSPKFNQ